ncbi:nitrogen fixation protein NifQ [Paraburkholderia flava]|uniref:nitrogen fixation protein NifQ n=1 Tax=Paraburkholderia flava TaxID=2547393 RepID=UPI00105CC56C|nr:nitrogen fixation protein NifQ [Paraburkholderia flava]
MTEPSAPLPHVVHPDGVDAACAARTAELAGFSDTSRTADTLLFARLVAARDVRGELALLGLTPSQWHALAARHFSHVAPTQVPVLSASAVLTPAHATFVAAMIPLLLAHVPSDVDTGDAQCIAAIIAHACLRPDHLWRDLGLTGRDDVTRMLTRYFPALVARNVDNLRWKKFLARELALSTGVEPGPAPGCPGCEDFGYCFPTGR